MLRRAFVRGLAALPAVGSRLIRAAAGYEADIAAWRKNYERDLKSENGPLYLAGRFDLPEGRTEIGSGTSSGISLPDRAPKRVGWIERRGDTVTFEPAAGIAVTVNGKPAAGRVALRAGPPPSPRDRIAFGDFEISVAMVDGTGHLMLRDRHSQYLRHFQGALWFPVNPGYRVEAAFTPYPQPKELNVPDTTGRARRMKSPGYVTFRLNGAALRLEPVVTGNELFFMFKDATSGRETYGAGRFLEAEMPKDGKVVLDFNKAYNPYCAFNRYTSCPIPPRQNHLMTRIEAGEKYRGEH